MKTARILLCQLPLGITLSKGMVARMKSYRPDFVCFPEYFFVMQRLGNHGQTRHNQELQIRRIRLLSRQLDAVVIGGTMPELGDGGALHNTTYVFDSGEPLGFYRKINLFFAEVGKITPGDGYRVFHSRGVTFGVMICADIFHDGGFHFMRKHGARVIFSPTFSLVKQETADVKFQRDNDIYVRGSRIAGAPIVKVCGVKSDYKNFLQARSLIATPQGVAFRILPEEEDREMLVLREIEV